ncbi:MAG: hypothetical protein RIT26_397, partial [Pseudomonadota bacterium]
MNSPRPPLLTLDEALPALLARAPMPGVSVRVDTFEADGRVLAQDLVAELQVPAQDNSSMDGYALRCADVGPTGAVLRVTQRIPAGSHGQPLSQGEAARIFTGAPIPSGADAVVMQEDTDPQAEGQVRIKTAPRPGQFIRRSGEDITRGRTVLTRGTRLRPAELGLAASLGLAQLLVAPRPRVALFSTGDELVMPGALAPADMPPGAI